MMVLACVLGHCPRYMYATQVVYQTLRKVKTKASVLAVTFLFAQRQNVRALFLVALKSGWRSADKS